MAIFLQSSFYVIPLLLTLCKCLVLSILGYLIMFIIVHDMTISYALFSFRTLMIVGFVYLLLFMYSRLMAISIYANWYSLPPSLRYWIFISTLMLLFQLWIIWSVDATYVPCIMCVCVCVTRSMLITTIIFCSDFIPWSCCTLSVQTHYTALILFFMTVNFQTFVCLLGNLVFEDEVKICNNHLTDLELWKIRVVWKQVQEKKLRCAVYGKRACDVFRSDRWKFTQVKYLILRVVSSRKMPYVSVCFNIVLLFVKMIAWILITWIVNSWSVVNKCIQTIIFIVVRYIYIHIYIYLRLL